jgi:hypothetical protein
VLAAAVARTRGARVGSHVQFEVLCGVSRGSQSARIARVGALCDPLLRTYVHQATMVTLALRQASNELWSHLHLS